MRRTLLDDEGRLPITLFILRKSAFAIMPLLFFPFTAETVVSSNKGARGATAKSEQLCWKRGWGCVYIQPCWMRWWGCRRRGSRRHIKLAPRVPYDPSFQKANIISRSRPRSVLPPSIVTSRFAYGRFFLQALSHQDSPIASLGPSSKHFQFNICRSP
jgi:hypothetical protein